MCALSQWPSMHNQSTPTETLAPSTDPNYTEYLLVHLMKQTLHQQTMKHKLFKQYEHILLILNTHTPDTSKQLSVVNMGIIKLGGEQKQHDRK